MKPAHLSVLVIVSSNKHLTEKTETRPTGVGGDRSNQLGSFMMTEHYIFIRVKDIIPHLLSLSIALVHGCLCLA